MDRQPFPKRSGEFNRRVAGSPKNNRVFGHKSIEQMLFLPQRVWNAIGLCIAHAKSTRWISEPRFRRFARKDDGNSTPNYPLPIRIIPVRTRLSPPFRNGYSQSIRVRINDLRLSGRARPLLLRLQRDVNQFCQVDRASAGSLSDLFLTAESVGHNQGLRRSRPHGRKQHALRNRL